MGHPDLTVSNFMEHSIGLNRVNSIVRVTIMMKKRIADRQIKSQTSNKKKWYGCIYLQLYTGFIQATRTFQGLLKDFPTVFKD